MRTTTHHSRGTRLAVLLTGQFMANVDTAVANIAAPALQADLNATEGQAALVVSAYVVAFAVLLARASARRSAIAGSFSPACSSSRSPPWPAASLPTSAR